MGLDDLNESTNGTGGNWVKLNEKGQTLRGAVLDSVVRPRLFDGVQVVSRAGNKRTVTTITLQTDLRDDDITDDDGIRKWDADEGGRMAIAAAKEELGRPIQLGDILEVKVTKSSVQGKHGADFKARLIAGPPPEVDVDTGAAGGDDDDGWDD